jgi:aspartate beta-hydroxylase
VVDPDRYFPAHRELLRDYEAIRRQTLAIALSGRLPANHDIMVHQRSLYEFDRKVWEMLPLRAYGYDYPANLELLPALAAFLRNHPEVVSAAVSVFPPGKRLRPHKGPFKGVFRYHLGLFIEDYGQGRTACELTVAGHTHYIHEGQGLLWDDTFMHEARNSSTQPRVVLLFDVLRNDQPAPLALLSRLVLWTTEIWQRLDGTRKRAGLVS